MISWPTGMIMPPPAPCSTRKSTSSVVEVGDRAQRRADREQHERGHVHALGAESPRRPPRHRDHGRQREQVAGHDPLDLGDRAVQVVPERPQRDVDDRRVEDRHDHPEDHHAGDLPDVGLDAVAGRASMRLRTGGGGDIRNLKLRYQIFLFQPLWTRSRPGARHPRSPCEPIPGRRRLKTHRARDVGDQRSVGQAAKDAGSEVGRASKDAASGIRPLIYQR